MNGTPEVLRERAEHHAKEAERLLKSWWLSTHVKAQVTRDAPRRIMSMSRGRAIMRARELWIGVTPVT